MSGAAAVAVVVVSHESRRWLPGLLDALARQTLAPAEIVVVDNGSRDGTVAWLTAERPEARVLALGGNAGFAHAANRGIAATRAPLLALLNPDVVPDADWLARLAARLADPGVGSVACRMVSLADPREIYDAGDLVRRDGACLQRGRGVRDPARHAEPGEVPGACAGAAVYRRAALDAVGGFDERYFLYLEDADLALALRAAGWRCAYEPARARHAGGGSAPRPGADLEWVARNTLPLVAKWFHPAWLAPVLYRQAALVRLAAREGRLRAHLRALGRGLALVPGAVRDRPRLAIPRAELIPAAPIRGPRAEGHPSRTGRGAGRCG